MQMWAMLITALIASRCVSAVVVCDGIAAERRDHAAALAEDGGPESVTTGRRLIAKLEAGCAEACGDGP